MPGIVIKHETSRQQGRLHSGQSPVRPPHNLAARRGARSRLEAGIVSVRPQDVLRVVEHAHDECDDA
jgi:hypothetical protein